MAVTIEWGNPQKTILRYNCTDNWAWDEFLLHLQIGQDLMSGIPDSICVLYDLTEVKNVPSDFIAQACSFIKAQPENTGLVIFVSTDMLFEAMFHVVKKLIPEESRNCLLMAEEEKASKVFAKWFSKNAQPQRV